MHLSAAESRWVAMSDGDGEIFERLLQLRKAAGPECVGDPLF